MKLNIIHLAHRKERELFLMQELHEQGIDDYKMWDGIIETEKPSVGISRAHKQIVNYARENYIAEILISEDDFHFTAEGAFQFFLKNKPETFDIYLGGISHGKLNEENIVTDFSGLFFYIVHEKFYDAFLSVSEEGHLDRSMRSKGKFVVCNPFAVIERDGWSDNSQSWRDNKYLFQGRQL